eukprot:TRINITY_DN24674_c0_g1_i2.p1 TRINITY_DN24674_c0_g1~~TRINITY_DN24674_c0_g1_i2.p1  ORF type:complete len:187 (+),score=45.60 TRINITY_DN24674_c0_g1_i2:130-690(+)
MLRSLVGSEMCIRDRYQRRVREMHCDDNYTLLTSSGLQVTCQILAKDPSTAIFRLAATCSELRDSCLDFGLAWKAIREAKTREVLRLYCECQVACETPAEHAQNTGQRPATAVWLHPGIWDTYQEFGAFPCGVWTCCNNNRQGELRFNSGKEARRARLGQREGVLLQLAPPPPQSPPGGCSGSQCR